MYKNNQFEQVWVGGQNQIIIKQKNNHVKTFMKQNCVIRFSTNDFTKYII